eukprot:TRINITY_DN8943_c0_g1_i2.p1 TRINITY_DN8943_c0_g1~~TRINITY_DN8943_c0_g1_i2.p1  ORF type:complete len:800 (+),score=122.71 TRINITY_DN8943_c0_g1_i2:108-2507(+)
MAHKKAEEDSDDFSRSCPVHVHLARLDVLVENFHSKFRSELAKLQKQQNEQQVVAPERPTTETADSEACDIRLTSFKQQCGLFACDDEEDEKKSGRSLESLEGLQCGVKPKPPPPPPPPLHVGVVQERKVFAAEFSMCADVKRLSYAGTASTALRSNDPECSSPMSTVLPIREGPNPEMLPGEAPEDTMLTVVPVETSATLVQTVQTDLEASPCEVLSNGSHTAFALKNVWKDLLHRQNSKPGRRSTKRTDSQTYFKHRALGLVGRGLWEDEEGSNVPDASSGEGRCHLTLPLHPRSTQRCVWNAMAILLLLYDFVVLPLSAFDLPPSAFLTGMSVTALLYWTLDILMSFITGCTVGGVLRMRWRAIALHYVRTWLAFDIIIVLPEWLLLAVGATTSAAFLRVLRGSRILRFMRMLRMLRLLRLVKLVKTWAGEADDELTLCFTLSRLCFGAFALCHVLASFWYAIGTLSSDGWVYLEGVDKSSLFERYLFTFQWSIARLHPSSFGKNDNLRAFPDRIFAITVSMLAFGLGSYFVGRLTNTMSDLHRLRETRTRQLHIVREYMRECSTPVETAIRVEAYLENTAKQRTRVGRAKDVAGILPMQLLADIWWEAWSPTLSVHPFFGKLMCAAPRIVWTICKDAIEEVFVFSGGTVFIITDHAEKMTFVSSGKLSYRHGRRHDTWGERTATGKGRDVTVSQWLCEPVLWTQWKHQGELQAVRPSTVLALHSDALVKIAKAREADAAMGSYARSFVNALNHHSTFLSDLLEKEFYEDLVAHAKEPSAAYEDSPTSSSPRLIHW